MIRTAALTLGLALLAPALADDPEQGLPLPARRLTRVSQISGTLGLVSPADMRVYEADGSSWLIPRPYSEIEEVDAQGRAFPRGTDTAFARREWLEWDADAEERAQERSRAVQAGLAEVVDELRHDPTDRVEQADPGPPPSVLEQLVAHAVAHLDDEELLKALLGLVQRPDLTPSAAQAILAGCTKIASVRQRAAVLVDLNRRGMPSVERLAAFAGEPLDERVEPLTVLLQLVAREDLTAGGAEAILEATRELDYATQRGMVVRELNLRDVIQEP
jgi:hypothetical protein